MFFKNIIHILILKYSDGLDFFFFEKSFNLENLFKSNFTTVEAELFTLINIQNFILIDIINIEKKLLSLNILLSVYYNSNQNNSKQWIKTPIVDYLFTVTS